MALATDTVENLVLDLLEWVGRKEHTYQEALDAWRTSCPRLPVWEEANDRGLLKTTFEKERLLVRVAPAGLVLLEKKRPQFFAQQPQDQRESRAAIIENRPNS